MKHLLKSAAVLLALITAVMTPVQTLAASESTKYVSEIVTVAAENENEAKSMLEKAGYKLIPHSNLNSTLNTGVYLGIKETDNKDEAITDIAAMNMSGKFSYSDYKQIMSDYRENIEQTVNSIETFIEEFQLNYGNETRAAVLAYAALNLFEDDDSGKTMGDYFLVYDFSEESKTSLTDTLMQANSDIVMSMIRTLSFAGDTESTTLIDRLSELGPEGIEDKYAGKYPTIGAFNKTMASEYGSVASVLYKDWNYFYDYLLDIERNIVSIDKDSNVSFNEDAFKTEEAEPVNTEGLTEDEKNFLESVSEITDAPEVLENTTDFGLYSLLATTDFGEGTLLDYFKRPSAEIDMAELYVIVECMSEGQKEQVNFVGIKEILQGAYSSEEATENEVADSAEQYSELIEDIEATSIFEGIDRSIYDDGVAFTSSAVQHEAITGKSWLDKLGGLAGGDWSYWNTTTITCWLTTCALSAICITASVMKNKAIENVAGLETAFEEAQLTYSTKFANLKKYMEPAYNSLLKGPDRPNIPLNELYEPLLSGEKDALIKCQARYESAQRTVKTITAVKAVSFVLLFVALAFDVYTLVDYLTSDKPTEESIPHHIMATASTSYGEDYIYYQTVKTIDGDASDVNNHEADVTVGWLVLYTTKDSNAGEAICADTVKVITGNNSLGEDSYFAHMFNESSALSTTDKLYTGVDDKTGGTYITYNRENSQLTASAVSNGISAIIAACGLAAGTVLGCVITAIISKKKNHNIKGDK